MSMLTHHFDGSLRSADRKSGIKIITAKLRLPTIKGLCLGTLAIVSAGGLVAGLIALRTAIYLSRLHY
ncbi:hypothetical protein CQ12_08145 [Bradyrhizobium jicamae]|uniref:Uncharacterized protein n=1 Tax=Bradyrhizobium jicamae TaxID=280332 RepID=A0A0R3LMQ2_9BRAD|nr:hypothetical protein [Bradyrhizobium jicamae]KRR08930.1 hypothetical protein CQ12_08145 [Bradyrhizobium jicamae]